MLSVGRWFSTYPRCPPHSPWRALHQVHVRLGTSCHRRGSRRRASTSRLQFVHGPIPAIAQHSAALWHPAYAAASAAGRPACFRSRCCRSPAVAKRYRRCHSQRQGRRDIRRPCLQAASSMRDDWHPAHQFWRIRRPHRGRGCWLVRTGRCGCRPSNSGPREPREWVPCSNRSRANACRRRWLGTCGVGIPPDQGSLCP